MEQYSKQHFLTGFMLIGALILYGAMTFVMLFLSLIFTSYSNFLVSLIMILITLFAYIYVSNKFEKAEKFSKLALYYVLSICLLGLIIPTIIYIVIVSGLLISYTGNIYLVSILQVFIAYIVYSEILALAGVFSIAFELRDLTTRSFSSMFWITSITIAVLMFVGSGFTIVSGLNMLGIGFLILVVTYYLLDAIVNGPINLKYETIEKRYHFVVNVITHAALAPIKLPMFYGQKLIKKSK